MRLNCGDNWETRWKKRKAYLEQWHPFFCLLPRRVGPGDCRWLEYIERSGVYRFDWDSNWWDWYYRVRP